MHLHPNSASHPPAPTPTISVSGTEVPLPLYFQAIDLYTAGHNTDSILVHIVATTPISNIDVLRETVQNIILNLQLISNSSQTLTVTGGSGSGSGSGSEENVSRRNSRIEFVGELDDLETARLLAGEKSRREKERRTLRGLLGRLG